jgi:hypothetical protein
MLASCSVGIPIACGSGLAHAHRAPPRHESRAGVGGSPFRSNGVATPRRALSRRRRGRGAPGPGADAAGARPVSAQMWQQTWLGACGAPVPSGASRRARRCAAPAPSHALGAQCRTAVGRPPNRPAQCRGERGAPTCSSGPVPWREGRTHLLVLRGLRPCELRLQPGDLQPARSGASGSRQKPEWRKWESAEGGNRCKWESAKGGNRCEWERSGNGRDLGLPLVQALVGLESGLATNVHEDSRSGAIPLRVHSHLGCVPT